MGVFLCIYIQRTLDPSLNLVQHHHHQAPASLLCILYPGHLDVWLGNTQPMLTLKFNKILSIVIINEKKTQNQSWEIRESTDVYCSILQFSMFRKPPIKNVIASFAISSLSSVLSSRTSTNKTSSVSFRSCLRLDTARSFSA